MAVSGTCVLRQRQLLAGGDAELPFDQIEPGDRFGHRMLDLQPRVHFHEPEAVGPQPARAVGDELDRAGADIADRLARPRPRPRPSRRATPRVMPGAGASSITFWWRRCSEQSRSLRWMALPCVSANTCISMWRGAVTYFSISTRASPNDDFRFALRAFERRVEIGVLVDAAHALAAAAGDRLDQHRIADLVGLLLEELRLLPLAVIARHHRHAGLLHQRLGAILQAHRADRRRRRADEDDAGGGAGFGERGVLGEKAVARMDAVARRPCARPSISRSMTR